MGPDRAWDRRRGQIRVQMPLEPSGRRRGRQSDQKLFGGWETEKQWAKPQKVAQTSPVVGLPGECRRLFERDPRSRSAGSAATEYSRGGRRQSAKQLLIVPPNRFASRLKQTGSVRTSLEHLSPSNLASAVTLPEAECPFEVRLVHPTGHVAATGRSQRSRRFPQVFRE